MPNNLFMWMLSILIHVRFIYEGYWFLVQKNVWRTSVARVWLTPQIQFWRRALLRFFTKSAHSNHFKRTKTENWWHVITPFLFDIAVLVHFFSKINDQSQFWCILNCSNEHFWCRFELIHCTKTVFAKEIKHVLLNSFKHVSAPKWTRPLVLNLNGMYVIFLIFFRLFGDDFNPKLFFGS